MFSCFSKTEVFEGGAGAYVPAGASVGDGWNQGTWGGSGKYLSMNCFNQFNKPTKVLVSDYMLSSLEMCSHRLILNYGRLFRDVNLNWICLECKYILGQIHRSGKKSGEKEKGKDTQQVRGTLVRLELEPCLCIPAICLLTHWAQLKPDIYFFYTCTSFTTLYHTKFKH